MQGTRRDFVRIASLAASVLAAPHVLAFTQRSIKPPPPPQPAQTPVPRAADANLPGVRAAKRAQLKKNAEEFRNGVEELYKLTGELREAVRNTETTDVLSVRTYKKTEQIEKLAKQLKSKAKGG